MHFITLLIHRYLGKDNKEGDSKKHDKFITDYFKLNSIQIYSTISH